MDEAPVRSENHSEYKMTNLLQETVEDIARSGHTPEDIVFIGSETSGHCCTWTEFQKLADIEYDAGFGAQEIASDLEIVFRDGAKMWRHEYDGSEHWTYSQPFKMPTTTLPITRLKVAGDQVGWRTLEQIESGE